MDPPGGGLNGGPSRWIVPRAWHKLDSVPIPGRLAWVAVLMVAATGTAAARPRAGAAASRRGEAERALRTGHYEEARQIAVELQRHATEDGAATAAILAARAEIALGLYPDARRRLETAAEAVPDNLPVRDALMRLYELTGERAALAPLIDRTYEDWKHGRVNRNRAADLIAVATAVRLDDNWKDASDTLRDAVHAESRSGDASVAASVAANLDWGWIFLEKH